MHVIFVLVDWLEMNLRESETGHKLFIEFKVKEKNIIETIARYCITVTFHYSVVN